MRRFLSALLVLLLASHCRRAEDVSKAREARRAAASASSSADAKQTEVRKALETLRAEEDAWRARTDFERLPPSSRALGANPYALVALPRPASADEPVAAFAALLRGDSRLVLLDRRLTEIASAATGLSPSGLALDRDGAIVVASPFEARLRRYRIERGSLEESAALPLPGAGSPRSVAADERAVFATDFGEDRLFALPHRGAPLSLPTCGGPLRVALTPRWLGVLCLFDHALAFYRRDARGLPGVEIARITHDGPFFGFALLEDADGLVVAAGGVEDHPLERRDKVFGYIDSFVFAYRVGGEGRVERRLALNVSELGVVTPKVLGLERRAGKLAMTAIGYGAERWVELTLADVADQKPETLVHTGVPGCADAVLTSSGRFCANPLFDAWVDLGEPPAFHPARPPDRADPSARERLGEALFFSTLMAPDASSDGRLSRFTCETCHFEGGTDGRVHHSGRDAVRVSTRPLFGLLNAAPHFSRAHDPDLTSVSHNEFRVANRGNPVDPWFTLDGERFPWLLKLGVSMRPIAPLELRRSLLAFLGRFSHEENPYALARDEARFSPDERRGAELFRARCERCHMARTVANDPKKAVPFERWEELVLSATGPLVWSSGAYEKTGVTPYVDAKGTRVPSLRRLYLKRPYLTNGSAPTLAELLRQARFSSSQFLHAPSAAGELEGLGVAETQALLAFLRLL